MLVLWGIIIAVAIYPLHKVLAQKLGGREKISASLITILGLAILIIPSAMFIDSTVETLGRLGENLRDGTFQIQEPPQKVAEWTLLGKPIYETWKLASTNLEELIIKYKTQIKDMAPAVFQFASGILGSLIMIFFSIIIAGVLLPLSEPANKAAKSIFKTLIGHQGKNFVELAATIIRSVVQGILGIAAIQSLMTAIGMYIMGIPGAGLWALIVLFLAIMQLPPILILGPVAIYSFTIADTTPAIIFTIYSIIVSMSDAVLKPIFLGRGVDVPMLAVLLGAIGGMIMSGIIGLFVGAVILAITYKVFEALLVKDVLDKVQDNDTDTNNN
jgi:predicted PurR-regulated permease PerM